MIENLQRFQSLSCDCYGGCWGAHSVDWPYYESGSEEDQQRASVYCRANFPYGSFVFVKLHMRVVNDEYLIRLREFMEDVKIDSPEDWQGLGTLPTPGTLVQRWHKMWKVPITVRQRRDFEKLGSNNLYLEWIEGTLSHSWPEEAFTPHWRSLPKSPI